MVSREEIEAALSSAAKDLIDRLAGRDALPGWQLLLARGVEMMKVGSAHIPVAGEALADDLVKMSEKSPLAYDAASYLASQSVLAGITMPTSLKLFAAKALAGEVRRPARRGAPPGRDSIIKAMQFSMVAFMVATDTVDLPLGRNEASPAGGNAPLCIFDAVANAFSEAGYTTTYEDVRSIYYAKSYADTRRLGHWMGGNHDKGNVFSF